MAPNPIDYFAIQNVISKYCIALDTKDFDLLHQVFTPDLEAQYPPFPGVNDLKGLMNAIEKRLAPVTTHHALTTQTLEVAADGKSAEATTYFTGIHFGKGKWDGQQVTAWGKYVDTLKLVSGEGDLPGSSGRWMISRRELGWMGRMGEEGVMEGE